MRIVGCFLQYEGRFVILLRHAHKPDGNTWGLPSGKVEQGEDDYTAMSRELAEETGYVAGRHELAQLGVYHFVSSRGQPYAFVAFAVQLQAPHAVQLEANAHSQHQWVTATECFALPDLIPDFHQLLQLVGYVPAANGHSTPPSRNR